MSVKPPHVRALANESCHGFQTFNRQSEGLAMRDYLFIIPFYFKEMFEQVLMCIGPVQNQNNIFLFLQL